MSTKGENGVHSDGGFAITFKGDLGTWGTTERKGHVGLTKTKTRNFASFPPCEPGTDLMKHHSEHEWSTGPAQERTGAMEDVVHSVFFTRTQEAVTRSGCPGIGIKMNLIVRSMTSGPQTLHRSSLQIPPGTSKLASHLPLIPPPSLLCLYTTPNTQIMSRMIPRWSSFTHLYM